jgi:pectinesterase inhibitor-like protein
MAGRSRALLVLAAIVATSCSLAAAQLLPTMGQGLPVEGMPLEEALPLGVLPPKAVADICRRTSFPDLCTVTAGKQAVHYETIDALTVLQMEVDALAMRTEAARARVGKEAQTASPAGQLALKQCDAFYGDVMENLGSCRRAINHKDAVTIRSTMSMVAQDLQFCDEEFRKAGEKNPLERFDQSLVNMSEICRSLSNMINT